MVAMSPLCPLATWPRPQPLWPQDLLSLPSVYGRLITCAKTFEPTSLGIFLSSETA